jgi:hypothetical protein
MRRSYISPEFDYKPVFGTYNMQEISSLFSSKMLEIEDFLEIHDQNLVYFQTQNSEQLDLSIESSLTPISYSASDDKKNNHTLVIDDSQSLTTRDTRTRWIMTINLNKILTNYLFATLKRWRTFEGVRNNMTKNNDVNFAIQEYIIKNVTDRYKLSKIELFINYVDIKDKNNLKFNNLWAGTSNVLRTAKLTTDISIEANRLKSFQSQTEFDFSSTRITFSQERNSSDFCFDYYFKLFYEKI